jgi:hypothetical protein
VATNVATAHRKKTAVLIGPALAVLRRNEGLREAVFARTGRSHLHTGTIRFMESKRIRKARPLTSPGAQGCWLVFEVLRQSESLPLGQLTPAAGENGPERREDWPAKELAHAHRSVALLVSLDRLGPDFPDQARTVALGIPPHDQGRALVAKAA